MDRGSYKDLRHTFVCCQKHYQNMKQQINNLLLHYEDKCNFQLYMFSKCNSKFFQFLSFFFTKPSILLAYIFSVF